MQPILKYPGAKWNLAEWIISYMPDHEIYLEPFFGSGAVFFNKQPSRLETINDLDSDVVNLFKVIREMPIELAHMIEYTPWARNEYMQSYQKTGNEIEDARRFLVRCWQAFGTKTNGKTGWRHSATKEGPIMPKQWSRVPERVKEVADRLKNAQIENMPAGDLIKKYNQQEVLIYADPPYILATRSGKLYKHEMTDNEHIELLQLLKLHKGSVIISNYDNEIYNSELLQWEKVSIDAAAEKGKTGKEVLWLNNVASNSIPRLI